MMYSIVALIAYAVMLIIAIGLAVYYSIYKKRINRQLENIKADRSTQKISTPDFHKVFTIVLIIAGILYIVYSNGQISSLYEHIGSLESDIRDLRNNLADAYEILNSYEDNLLEAENFVEDYTLSYDNLNLKDCSYDLIIKVLPKINSDDAVIIAKLSGETVTLKKDDEHYYSGKIKITTFDVDGTLSLVYSSSTDNQKQEIDIKEELTDIWKDNLLSFSYNTASPSISWGTYDSSKQTMQLKINGSIEIYGQKTNPQKVELIVDSDDSEIYRGQVDFAKYYNAGNSIPFTCYEKLEKINDTEAINISLEITDDYGFIYYIGLPNTFDEYDENGKPAASYSSEVTNDIVIENKKGKIIVLYNY